MKSAFRNFGFTLLIIVFLAGLGWVTIRQKTMSEGVRAPIDHPFVKTEKLGIVATLDPKSKVPAMEQYDRLSQLNPDIILWADITVYLHGGLFVTQTLDGDKVEKAVSFKDFVARYPKHKLIISVSGNRPGMEEEVLREVDATKASDRMLIQSPEDGMLKDLREKRPQWIFGTSDAQVVQMKMVASIGLPSAAPLKGDVLVLGHPVSLRPELHFTLGDYETMINEGHRRRMKVYVGPAHSREEAQALRDFGADGIFTAKPEDLF